MKKNFKKISSLILASLLLLNSISPPVFADDLKKEESNKQVEEKTDASNNKKADEEKINESNEDKENKDEKTTQLRSVQNAQQNQVTYEYKASDGLGREIKDIPQEIMNTLPKPQDVAVGDSVTPTEPSTKTFQNSKYKERIGKWKFKGFDKKSLKVSGDKEKDVFVGEWTFTDLGFRKSPYLGNQYIRDDLDRYKVGKIYLEITINRLKDVNPPEDEPFKLPKTYTITALLGDDKGQTRTGVDGREDVAIGYYKEDPSWKRGKFKRDSTEGGYLVDSYGKPVTLPMFDENGVGIQYSIQNLDPAFPNEPNDDGKIGSDHHHRWWKLTSTPKSDFNRPDPKTGEILANTYFYDEYTELVSSEFRSSWLTNLPEEKRPTIRAKIPPSSSDEGDVYVPLLKKNYKDDPQNFVRVRTDGANDVWFNNFKEDYDKEEYGLLDNYHNLNEKFNPDDSDLRKKLPVSIEGIKDGFVEKDGHRFKASITYDIYKGAYATFQEEYKVKYHPEGGEFTEGGSDEKSFGVLHGEKIDDEVKTKIKLKERKDYVFKGWREGKDDPIVSFDSSKPVTKNMDLYAIWEEKPIVVTKQPKLNSGDDDKDYRKLTFDPNGGKFWVSDKPVTYWILKSKSFDDAMKATNQASAKILNIPIANKEDHDFLGWVKDKKKDKQEYNTELKGFTQQPGYDKDETLFAFYKEKTKGTVSYVFQAKDSNGKVLKTLPEELKALLPVDKTRYLLKEEVKAKEINQKEVRGTCNAKKGTWTFKGWNPTELLIKEKGNTFTGVWEFTVDKHDVTFHTEGGEFSDKTSEKVKTIPYGDSLKDSKAEESSRQYYKFLGWFKSKEDSAEKFDINAPVTEDMDLYAKWEKKTPVVTKEPKSPSGKVDEDYRKITFDSNGGKLDKDKKIINYWILKDLSFEDAKEVIDSKTNEKIIKIPKSNRNKFTWLGWSLDRYNEQADIKSDLSNYKEEENISTDITFYAIYKKDSTMGEPREDIYTIFFDYDGGKDDKGEKNYTIKAKLDEIITIIKAPKKEGYKFLYWKGSKYNPDDKYTVKGNHTFVAVWEKDEAKPGILSKMLKNSGPKTGVESFAPYIIVLALSSAGLIFSKKKDLK